MRFVFAALLFLLPLTLHAQDTLWTPQHVAKLRVVTEAVISPDGTQVAYVLSVPREIPKEKDGPSWAELHVVDTKGVSTPFITGPVNVANIAWSPDGKSITFLAKRDKDTTRCLYMIGAKGGESKLVQKHDTDIQGYSWKADSTRIAFLATDATPKDKKAKQDQGFNQEIYEEDTPFVRVWLRQMDGSAAPQMVKLNGSASELHFNPKENKLAVAVAPSPGIDDHIMFRKVHIVDLASGKATDVKNPGKLGQLAWSPDGKKLAMITGHDKHDPKEGRLWVYDTEKSSNTDMLPKFAGHIESIIWDTDANLMYTASMGVATITATVNGSTPGETWRRESEFIESSITVARDGRGAAFIVQSPAHPPEVYFHIDEKNPRRLTDSNPWLKTMKMAKQEVIKHKAKDGLELEGVLIRPLNEDQTKRYPLVLTVHGGPEAHYSNGWLTMYHSLGQVAAARGMAVFYPNYRGSTGYGVEFSMKGQREAAGKEFDDLIDGVDHLVKSGLVHENKVGITGGSYGGYATAWGSTVYSHRFAAGVMFVGISDWISCSGTTDIPQEMFLVHHRKWLWDDWDYFKKASPIAHLDKHKTPLLIMHGKADPRVNPGQSLEFYRHLKVRNQAPVRLVLYPGEGHGNRRAASKLDYNLRLLQWMEHYLKGPGGAMPAMDIEYGLPAAPTKTSSWDNRRDESEALATGPWLGRGCPCCIGW